MDRTPDGVGAEGLGGHKPFFEHIANALVRAGTERVFGVMGEGNLAVVTAMAAQGVSHVAARREDGAATMADGWARRRGRVGVASVTHGPGLTNAVTALLEATRHRTPMVLLAGIPPRDALDHGQRVSVSSVTDLTGAGWRRLRGPRSLVSDVRAAFRGAVLERRPYVVGLPYELLYDHVTVDARDLEELTPSLSCPDAMRVGGRPQPASEPIDRAVELIARSQRPLVLAGQGAVLSDARAALEALAESTDALLATTLPAKGLFGRAPRYVGTCGGFGSSGGITRIRDADLVLAFGCGLNPRTTMNGALFEQAAVVHCDLDPAAFADGYPSQVQILADVRATAEQLTRRCAGAGPRPVDPTSAPAREIAPSGAVVPVPFRPDDLVREIRGWLPPSAIVAVDNGLAAGPFAAELDVDSHDRFIYSIFASATGLGTGLALGASIGSGQQDWTFFFTGDGSLLMQLQELESVGRLRAAMVIVVMDDDAFGAEVQYSARRGISPDLSYVPSPDLCAVAEGLGIRAHRIGASEQLRVIDEILAGARRPHLLHVPVDNTGMTEVYRRYIEGA